MVHHGWRCAVMFAQPATAIVRQRQTQWKSGLTARMDVVTDGWVDREGYGRVFRGAYGVEDCSKLMFVLFRRCE